jgi:hypothetical protein
MTGLLNSLPSASINFWSLGNALTANNAHKIATTVNIFWETKDYLSRVRLGKLWLQPISWQFRASMMVYSAAL